MQSHEYKREDTAISLLNLKEKGTLLNKQLSELSVLALIFLIAIEHKLG
jgi:hypothetical protein